MEGIRPEPRTALADQRADFSLIWFRAQRFREYRSVFTMSPKWKDSMIEAIVRRFHGKLAVHVFVSAEDLISNGRTRER